MQIDTTPLAGLLLLRPDPVRDERGLFTRTFDTAEAAAVGIDFGASAQDSQSRSDPGVLRGLHGRMGRGEAKLVRCAHGRVLDVTVDARPDSPTFGEHYAVELDDLDFCALYVPAGFLHGIQVLSPTPADVCYRIDRPHDPAEDVSVRWDDPDLAVSWRGQPDLVSGRDRAAGSWADLVLRLRAG